MIQKQLLNVFLISFVFIFFSSCISKRNFITHQTIAKKEAKIYIAMPQNNFVFENISLMIDKALSRHYKKIGYNIVNKQKDCLCLHITIEDLSSSYNYVSSDVLLFHSMIKLKLKGKLLDFKGNIVMQKSFFFSSLISKPRNPIMSSNFTTFEYQKLINKAAPKIEQYFRASILKLT